MPVINCMIVFCTNMLRRFRSKYGRVHPVIIQIIQSHEQSRLNPLPFNMLDA